MRNFYKLAEGLDVTPLMLELQRQPHLWNRNTARLVAHGPHAQTSDIWIRYKDEAENKASGDYRNFGDEHDPIWYPSYYALPECRRLIFEVMARVQGERLGGVLIYKVEPGRKILPHVDSGWHVEYYDKFNVYLNSKPGCTFFYADGERIDAKTGDLYWFVNHVEHWVENTSDDDHVVLTVCVRTHRIRE